MFTMILGTTKGGKSLELLSKVTPYLYTDKKVLFVQSARNQRENDISSRLGASIKSKKVKSLREVKEDFDVIGIDEIHMFEPQDADAVKKWLLAGKHVFISGLDGSHYGTIFEIIVRLLALKPNEIIMKRAVCENCKKYDACYVVIIDKKTRERRTDLPEVVPDDGGFDYMSVCRDCFFGGVA